MYRNQSSENAAKYYLSGLKGALASERIVNELVKYDTKRCLSDLIYSNDIAQKYIGSLFKLRNIIRMLITRERSESYGYVKQKFAGVTHNEVKEIIAQLGSASGRFDNMIVKKIGETCFYISREKTR